MNLLTINWEERIRTAPRGPLGLLWKKAEKGVSSTLHVSKLKKSFSRSLVNSGRGPPSGIFRVQSYDLSVCTRISGKKHSKSQMGTHEKIISTKRVYFRINSPGEIQQLGSDWGGGVPVIAWSRYRGGKSGRIAQQKDRVGISGGAGDRRGREGRDCDSETRTRGEKRWNHFC